MDQSATLRAYAIAVPGHEPALPPLVNLLSHHLHCIMHSAIVAGVVTLLLWVVRRSLWIPLFGWWSHIVIDVFTHSAEYYPAQVLYPLTQRGFDGLAWNTPWFLLLNYAVLAAVGVWLQRTGPRHDGREPVPNLPQIGYRTWTRLGPLSERPATECP